jgi:hypothetical protein
MELLVALAAVVVAAASLVLAYVFSRRSDTYRIQLRNAERKITELGSRQTDNVNELSLALRREVTARTDQLATSERRIIDHGDRSVSQLSDLLTRTIRDHGSRLASVEQLASDVESLRSLAAETAELRAETQRHGQDAEKMRGALAKAERHTPRRLDDIEQRLLALARDVDQILVDDAARRSQMRTWIRHGSWPAHGYQPGLVMPGFTYTDDRVAAEILPGLYEQVLRRTEFVLLLREQAPGGGCLYLVQAPSSDGQSPEQLLGQLLDACQDDDVVRPGLAELRDLIAAIHAGGPGTVRLGPLIVNCTADDTVTGVMATAEEVAILDDQDPCLAHHRWAEQLPKAAGQRVVNLTEWVARQSA